jgi:hypothetical protein
MAIRCLRAVRLLLALLGLVGSVTLLAGCGKSLSELLNESQVYTASATPNPVPAAAVTQESPFTINARVDSNGADDDLLIYLRNPSNGKYELIGFADICPAVGDNCGIKDISVNCFSYNQPGGSRRMISCPGGGAFEVSPGTHTVRVEINSCNIVTGCSRAPDDSFDFTLTIR